jgi:hypothetical protein
VKQYDNWLLIHPSGWLVAIIEYEERGLYKTFCDDFKLIDSKNGIFRAEINARHYSTFNAVTRFITDEVRS